MFLLAWMLLSVPAALAQSADKPDAELRTQLQKLKEQVRQLQSDLDAANRKVAELEKQVRDLGGTPAGTAPAAAPAGAPAGTPAPGGAPAPSGPASTGSVTPEALANAASFLNAVRERFAADFAKLQVPNDGTSATDDRNRRVWQQEAERWVTLINREYRRPVAWTVAIRSGQLDRRGALLEVVCVDPTTGAAQGRPFGLQLQITQASRLSFGRAGEPPAGLFLLKGTLTPQLVVNPSRLDAGPFDQPHLVGMMVDFGFRVGAQSIVPVAAASGSAVPAGAPAGAPASAPAGAPAGAPAPPPAGNP